MISNSAFWVVLVLLLFVLMVLLVMIKAMWGARRHRHRPRHRQGRDIVRWFPREVKPWWHG